MRLILAVIVALIALVTIRATWTPVAPLRLGRRRSWGQPVGLGLVTAYVYFDARTRVELEPVEQGELPAEVELARG